MKHRSISLCQGFALLTVLSLTRMGAAQAQQPGRDLKKFQLTVSGTAQAVGMIPTDPPLVIATMQLKGTSDLLAGTVTLTDGHLAHIGIDGTVLLITDGNGVFAGPSGDSFSVSWSAIIRPTENSDTMAGLASFTIRGGAGTLAGAVGSGICNFRLNLKTLEVTQVWEGLIALPKK